MKIEATTTLGAVAAQSLHAVRLLEREGFDYCCGGRQTLEQACAAKGMDWAQFAHAIEAAAPASPVPGDDWNTSSLAALVDHIVASHHAFLRREFPRLRQELSRVQRAHAKDLPVLGPLDKVFSALEEELDQHMLKEEQILFPFLRKMEADVEAHRRPAPMPFGSLQNPIRMMLREHEDAGQALAEIRRLTADFKPPAHACPTYRALWAGLAEFEADLHQHIHLENNILFPRGLEMEASQS